MIFDSEVRASTGGAPYELVATGRRYADGVIVFPNATEAHPIPTEVLGVLNRELRKLGRPIGSVKRTVGKTAYEISFARGGE